MCAYLMDSGGTTGSVYGMSVGDAYYILHLVFVKFMGAQVIDALCVLHSTLSVF